MFYLTKKMNIFLAFFIWLVLLTWYYRKDYVYISFFRDHLYLFWVRYFRIRRYVGRPHQNVFIFGSLDGKPIHRYIYRIGSCIIILNPHLVKLKRWVKVIFLFSNKDLYIFSIGTLQTRFGNNLSFNRV